MYVLTLLVLIVLAINQSFALGKGKSCCLDENEYLEGARARRTNGFSSNATTLVYTLDIWRLPRREDEVHRRDYIVVVDTDTTLNITKGMNAVKIFTKGSHGCGEGQFTFYKQDFLQFQYPHCPSVFDSEIEAVIEQSPILYWSPPLCGCVSFRVIVVDGSQQYYKDEKSVENGPLSRKVCITKQRSRLLYLKALCHATSKASHINAIGNEYFLSRLGIDSWFADASLMRALENRWSQIRTCCAETTETAMVNCMDDIRRRRIELFCWQNVTFIPIVKFKADFTYGRQRQCCNHEGQAKYLCFGERGELTGLALDRVLDYSMEDTDVANDLAIFGSTQDKDILGYVTVVEIQERKLHKDLFDDKLKTKTNKKTTIVKIKGTGPSPRDGKGRTKI